MQGGHHRLGQVESDVGQGAGQQLAGYRFAGGFDFLEVGTGTEGPVTGATQDDGAHGGVVTGAGPDLGQLPFCLAVQGIETLGTVERDLHNAVAQMLVIDCHPVRFR